MEKIASTADPEGSLFFKLSVENNHRLLSSALSIDMRSQATLLLTPLSYGNVASYSHADKDSNKLYSQMKTELIEKAKKKSFVPAEEKEDIEEALQKAKLRVASLESDRDMNSSELLKMRAIQEMFSHNKSKSFFKASWDPTHRR